MNLGMVEKYIKISTWMMLKMCLSLVWRKDHIARKSMLVIDTNCETVTILGFRLNYGKN